jgi:excisionase family DNA binding protein
MARRREEEKILDVNATMQGTLIFSDPVNLRINGRFEGNLKTKGNLIIGEEATVFADIEGENIVISGRVKGKVKSTSVITLTPTATLDGEIETPKLCIQEGAVFNGRCRVYTERLTLHQVADYLSVEAAKIVEWVNSGKVPAQKEGNELIFDKRVVELWVAQNR